MAKPKRARVSRYFCDEDCNNCSAVENRQVSLILNALHERFGDGVYEIVQLYCPNMTCCADCRIDDFCHLGECEILDEAEKWAQPTQRGRRGR